MTFVFYRWGNSQIWYWDSYHKLEMWCNKVRLSVNTKTTGSVVFIRRRKRPDFFEPHFFGVTLRGYMLVKYLAAVLDFQLT